MHRNKLGAVGEAIAASQLKKAGWLVLFRNYRLKFGELDIIARDPQGVLVFVEVKTLSRRYRGLSPEDHLTAKKLFTLRRLGNTFANMHSDLVNREGWRIDLMAISAEQDALTDSVLYCTIKTYKNIS